MHNQRGALALANGRVYVAYGGRFGDCGDYKGRIVSVAADGSGTPAEYAIRADRQGGFWGPMGPVVAARRLAVRDQRQQRIARPTSTTATR